MSGKQPKLDARAALRERAGVVLWGIALVGGVQAIGAWLAQRHAAAVVMQLVAAEFGTGRLGVAWSDPLAPMPTSAAIGKRVARGAAFGGAAAVILVGGAVLFRAAQLATGTPGIAPIVVGLVASAALGARDELLLRGLVLRALGVRTGYLWRLGVCGLAGAAFRWGEGGANVWALLFAGFSGAALAALWIRDRGAWLAVAANAAFVFASGTLATGALIDVSGARPLDSTPVAAACGAFFAVSAWIWGRKDAATQTG